MGSAIGTPLLAVRRAAPLQVGSLFVLQYQTVANGFVITFVRPVLIDTTLWLQGVTSLSLPLQLSPVVGGVVR
ncbi:MAG: hypothetical protein ACI89X_000595 [Planctomycetota bacterium]|jgi:hypothetical protein